MNAIAQLQEVSVADADTAYEISIMQDVELLHVGGGDGGIVYF